MVLKGIGNIILMFGSVAVAFGVGDALIMHNPTSMFLKYGIISTTVGIIIIVTSDFFTKEEPTNAPK